MRPDIERQALVDNPYSGNEQHRAAQMVADKLYRIVVIGGSLYFLHTWQVYATILRSPKMHHEWFKVGLAASVGLLFIKAYVEMFAGKLKKKKVNYENFPQSTHAAILFILLSSVAFHAALWPAYGWKTVAIMILVGYGVLLQFCLLVPTYVQNIVGFVAMTFFIQEYV